MDSEGEVEFDSRVQDGLVGEEEFVEEGESQLIVVGEGCLGSFEFKEYRILVEGVSGEGGVKGF